MLTLLPTWSNLTELPSEVSWTADGSWTMVRSPWIQVPSFIICNKAFACGKPMSMTTVQEHTQMPFGTVSLGIRPFPISKVSLFSVLICKGQFFYLYLFLQPPYSSFNGKLIYSNFMPITLPFRQTWNKRTNGTTSDQLESPSVPLSNQDHLAFQQSSVRHALLITSLPNRSGPKLRSMASLCPTLWLVGRLLFLTLASALGVISRPVTLPVKEITS